MTSSALRIALLVFALFFASTAQAQLGDWYVTPSVIFNDDDGDRNVDDSLSGAQVVAGRDLTKNFTFEGLLGYSSIKGYRGPPVFDIWPDQKHLDLSANLLAYFNRDSMFAPYLLVGLGYLAVDAEEGSIFLGNTGRDNRPTASYGVGLKWHMGQSQYSVRTEYRTRIAFGDPNDLTDRLWTIGLQYDFGHRASDPGVPESNKDTDGDGVLDIWDACANTKPGVVVTSRGCELQNIDRDGDEDRIFDSKDECPNTPIGVAVDRFGCALDSDMDGVPTGQDRCPASRAGAEVNIYGCEVDEDNDGVPDHRDDCLDTRAGVRVDVKGCEIRDIISLPGVNFETGPL